VLVQHVVLDGSLDARMARTLVAKQDVLDRALDVVVERVIPALPETAATEAASRKAITQAASRVTEAHRGVAHAALRRIAGMCDGAVALDGHGFNRLDAHIGRSLAERERLTDRQVALALKLVRKYRRQLGTLAEGVELTLQDLERAA
jgi:hypothetical protein